MTKSQTFYYVAAVVCIVVGTYLYTSIVEAPHHEEMEIGSLETMSETDTVEALADSEDEETTPSSGSTTTTELLSSSSETEEVLPNHPLFGSSWSWQYTEASDGSRVTPKKTGAFVLSFIDAGRMSSKTDCNSLGGEYKTAKDTLIFGDMMSTLMFCENSDETVYRNQLQSVARYQIDGSVLSLFLRNGEEMIFTLVN